MSLANLFLRRLFLLSFLVAALGCALGKEQSEISEPVPSPSASIEEIEQDKKSDAIARPTSEPYTGSLSIFENPKRDEQLQINRVMDLLSIKEGSNVADIGAGSGWFTVRAARRVGANGLVYAVEINPDYIKHIDERAKTENLPNIRTVLGKEDNPLLPGKTIDAVLLLKTYHELSDPIRLLRYTRAAMRSGGLLGVIDRAGRGDDHGIDAEVVIEEAGRAGFVLVEKHDFVKASDVDYFLVFRAR